MSRHLDSLTLRSAVHIEFLVCDDILGHGDGFERDLACATPLDSPIVFGQNKWIGILIQLPVNFRVVDTRLAIVVEFVHGGRHDANDVIGRRDVE